MKTFFVWTDGGAVGNPGPAAVAFIIKDETEKTIYQFFKYIGETTNNQAEYQALIAALEKLRTIGINKEDKIKVFLDSELIVNQLNRKYKVKNQGLKPLFLKAYNLAVSLGDVSFQHIFREENKEADKLVKKAIFKNKSNV